MKRELIIDTIITVIWLSVSAGIGWFTTIIPAPIGILIVLCLILITLWVAVLELVKKYLRNKYFSIDK